MAKHGILLFCVLNLIGLKLSVGQYEDYGNLAVTEPYDYDLESTVTVPPSTTEANDYEQKSTVTDPPSTTKANYYKQKATAAVPPSTTEANDYEQEYPDPPNENSGDEEVSSFNCESNNPCAPLMIPNKYYYAVYDEPTQFLQCDAHGGCYTQSCGAGTIWDDGLLTCIHGAVPEPDLQPGGGPGPVVNRKPKLPRGYSCINNDPCNPRVDPKESMYENSDDPQKFIYCGRNNAPCTTYPCPGDNIFKDGGCKRP